MPQKFNVIFLLITVFCFSTNGQPAVEAFLSRDFVPEKFDELVADWGAASTIKEFDVRHYLVVRQLENAAFQASRKTPGEAFNGSKQKVLAVPARLKKIASRALPGTIKDFKKCSVEIPFDPISLAKSEGLPGNAPFEIKVVPNSFLEPYVLAVLFRLYSTLSEKERSALIGEVENPSENFRFYLNILQLATKDGQ